MRTHASTAIPLDAFNIVPGVVFTATPVPRPGIPTWLWCAVNVTRDSEVEDVHIWARVVPTEGGPVPEATERAFVLDFNDPVSLYGIIINPSDPDDDNYGRISD